MYHINWFGMKYSLPAQKVYWHHVNAFITSQTCHSKFYSPTLNVAYISFEVSRLVHEFFQSLSTFKNSLNVLSHDTFHLLHLWLQCCDLIIAAATFFWETFLKPRQHWLTHPTSDSNMQFTWNHHQHSLQQEDMTGRIQVKSSQRIALCDSCALKHLQHT